MELNDSFSLSHLGKPAWWRAGINDFLDFRSVDKHRTTIGWRNASQYSAYWEQCQRAYGQDIEVSNHIRDKVDDFKVNGFTSLQTEQTQNLANKIWGKIQGASDIWVEKSGGSGNKNFSGNFWVEFPEIEELFSNVMTDFLTCYFGCDFKVWQAVLYQSTNLGQRQGSQGWHSDSGPGSCVNMLFYLHEMGPESGGIELLPWEKSVEVWKDARRGLRNAIGHLGARPEGQLGREYISRTVKSKAESSLKKYVVQPRSPKPGLVVPFLNNLQHAGGYPAPGFTRTAIVFQFYPADRPIDWERYAKEGVVRDTGYPHDPALVF
ncbi:MULTISPECIES: hypothetical protein [Thalassospira]|uniref:Phytanoyl-CoA dioxygenase n=1 Tax=Thalassospira profundimaris TaxID=502049 RepID=A0A367VJL3_9PROT|nr:MULTISPECIES: hypothetical protein [Thalassospira]KZB70939.1 hypothetical protein AUQ43_08815 [Thalassospira sp. MCCC 1A01148]MBR9899341.1 hypothetical protein [Rhodospirillales bacterium]RCK25418.1 hypothetical protein TH6_02040 [Thalassospira profundimaris]